MVVLQSIVMTGITNIHTYKMITSFYYANEDILTRQQNTLQFTFGDDNK